MIKSRLLSLAMLAMVVLLVGCGSSSLRFGWHETSSRAHKAARYETFSGTEDATIRAEAGQTITLSYDVEVSKGSLGLALYAPDGTTLWEETFPADASDTVALRAPEDGRYTVRVVGVNTGGSFDISWQTED